MGQLVSMPDSPRTLTLPIGAASPLWLAFAGAASAGVAYWWMTRWARSSFLDIAPAIARETPAPLEPLVEVLELQKVVVEAVIKVAEPVAPGPAPAEVLAAPEPAPPPATPVTPVTHKAVAKAPKAPKAAADMPAKAASLAKAPAVVAKTTAKPAKAAEAKVEPVAAKSKPAPRKPTARRPAKST